MVMENKQKEASFQCKNFTFFVLDFYLLLTEMTTQFQLNKGCIT